MTVRLVAFNFFERGLKNINFHQPLKIPGSNSVHFNLTTQLARSSIFMFFFTLIELLCSTMYTICSGWLYCALGGACLFLLVQVNYSLQNNFKRKISYIFSITIILAQSVLHSHFCPNLDTFGYLHFDSSSYAMQFLPFSTLSN